VADRPEPRRAPQVCPPVNPLVGGLALGLALAAAPDSGRPEQGMALGLFSADPDFDYGPMLREIRSLEATHVSVVWVWWQNGRNDAHIRPVPGRSATSAQVVRTLRQARKLGLHATLFPIVRLLDRGDGAWRGQIAPRDEDRWWDRYTAYILEAALVAKHARAQRLSVGSELLSRESMRDRWLELIDRVRLRAPELELMYSANWDHYRPVSFWDAVDVVGLTAYWELTRNPDASVRELERAWRHPRRELLAWSEAIGRPVVLTEVGYPSLDGGAAWPWDETRRAPVDLEEQRRAYLAFVRAWTGQRRLQGAYFWNWFGFGGEDDAGYTPRRKPAAEVVRCWFGGGGRCDGGPPSTPNREHASSSLRP